MEATTTRNDVTHVWQAPLAAAAAAADPIRMYVIDVNLRPRNGLLL